MGTTEVGRIRPVVVAALLAVTALLLGWHTVTALPDLVARLAGALDEGADLGTVVTEAARAMILLAGALLALTGSQVAFGAVLSSTATASGWSTRAGPAPRWWRAAVLAACGTALLAPVAAPGSVSGPPERGAFGADDFPPLTGLPLPDLPETTARPPSRPTQPIVVRPGDSLWTIAARTGPADATDAVIARRVARLYADNRSQIGPDPDLIYPGTTLHGGAR